MRKFPLRKVRPASQPRSSTAIATIFLPKFERTTWELDRQWAIQLNPLPLFFTDGKGSYRIAFVWAGFIRPLESPTKNALNAICSDSDSIHLQHHQISSLNLDIRLLYISNLNQAYQLCCQLISTFAEDCEHCQKRDINKWTKRSDVQSS